MKKFLKTLVLTSTIFSTVLISSCGNKVSDSTVDTNNDNEIKRVTFYGWGGDVQVNQWLDEYVATEVKERYNINFTRVGMNIDEILAKLLNEKQISLKSGDIDIVWINGENFNLAKNYGVLSDPFTHQLENFQYIDTNADFVNNDFGVPIDGMEAPFGLAHLIFIGESAKIDLPSNTTELLEIAKANPGTITYPAPPDFTGSAFVRNIIYDIIGVEAFENLSNDKEAIKEVIQPALDYLNELEPYLWQEGKTYPKEEAVLQKMYSDGQLYMTMSYTALLGPRNIAKGDFTETSEMFMFENGNIGNAHYLTIPYNAPHYEEAIQVLNFILSPEAQASKLNINNWGDLAVTDYTKLEDAQKVLFDEVNKNYKTLDNDTLMNGRLPEIESSKIMIIEELWEEEVLNK